MSADDLAQGLRAIDEEDVRQKVAAGDLSAAGGLDLTDEEAGLLRGAADDYPEVAGFAFDAFIKIDGFGDGSFGGAGGKELVKLDSPSYNQALQYLGKI
jgi:hypothetical protein